MHPVSAFVLAFIVGCAGGAISVEASADADAPTDVVDVEASTPDTATDAGPRPVGRTHVVLVTTYGFDPFIVMATRGDTVEWRWTTPSIATVTSGFLCLADGHFDSGAHVEPATFSARFVPSIGPYPYFDAFDCETHVGVVLVLP